ncbi:hypothetical protein XELAEV_18043812mg [Xenopus laevis]|uniref:Uncharacterized protein n=1 Tax=Xenopus laevis TaxID=8355 RepID=A0A974BXT4_XENLA|nr:hypothetical protein XELAEV_18043812mg [Xenopus laevis]
MAMFLKLCHCFGNIVMAISELLNWSALWKNVAIAHCSPPLPSKSNPSAPFTPANPPLHLPLALFAL